MSKRKKAVFGSSVELKTDSRKYFSTPFLNQLKNYFSCRGLYKENIMVARKADLLFELQEKSYASFAVDKAVFFLLQENCG